jgi:hypothetical protein
VAGLSDSKYGSWVVPESPVDVEYSLLVIEEIRQVVAEGFQRLSRGGMEVGGVLYGTREGRTLRIQGMRPIACEHARGPTFHLSEKDLAGLTAQLEHDREDPRLEGQEVLGWFLSHTRSEINLQASDLKTYQEYFPEPWQVTLVIRPGRSGAMRAGFFVREPDSSVKTEKSYLDFNFPDRLGFLDRPPGERRERRGMPPPPRYDAPSVQDEAPSSSVPSYDGPTFGQPQLQNFPPSQFGEAEFGAQQKKLPWGIIAVVVLVLIAGVLGFRYYTGMQNVAPDPLGLAVLERDNQLQIQWNRTSQSLAGARRASLEITDGTDKRSITLTAQDLAKGSFTYARTSGDVQVRLLVDKASGEHAEEASRFLGAAPENVDADEMDLLKVQRDALQDEVARLREQNTTQAERIQQLERTLTVLRARLGIAQDKR